MAETRNPQHTDFLRMDGSLGPWTVNLPAGFQGASVGLGTVDKVPANVTLNADSTDQIRTPQGNLVGSFAFDMIREGYNLVFHGADGYTEWYLQSLTYEPIITLGDTAATPIATSGDTRINVSYRSGDDQLFTFNPDGSFTANYTFTNRIVELRAYLVVDLTVAANNQMINVGFSFRRLSGTGPIELFPGGQAFAHSRTAVVSVDSGASALYSPVAGDVLELYGWTVDNDGASAGDVVDGTMSIEVL